MGDRSKTSSCCRRQRRKQLLSSLSQMYGFGDRRERGGARAAPYSRGGDEESNPCKVFVGNLSYDTTWKGLKDHFARAGNVEYAEVLEGPNGRSKGIGIVRFGTEEEALAAIDELTETDLDGREIFVRADRGGSAGKGGGGRGGGKGKGGGKGGKGSRGGKGGKGERMPSATDLDDDLDSYMNGGGNGGGNGGEGAENGEGGGGKRGKGGGKGRGRRGEGEPPSGAALDDDLDSYFSKKKGQAEAAPEAAE